MTIDLVSPDRTIHAGVILTQGITELIDVAPFEFFAWTDTAAAKMLNLPADMHKEAFAIKLHWVTQDGEPARMKSTVKMQPTDSFATCPPLDIVLMGAHDPAYHCNEAELAFIRAAYEHSTAFLTVCGGVIPLLEAGLLAGKQASAPRMMLGLLRKMAPDTQWLDRRWTHDGKLWSSSTLLNGMDLMRAFAEQTWGGRGGFVEALLDAGHYPAREVEFKDFRGVQFEMEGF